MKPEHCNYTELSDFSFGHASDWQAKTGCTVILAPEGATAGVDVRGGAPATRETDLLRPENTVDRIHAVVLSGGSAFGLAAADGVMTCLSERGIGFPFANACVPIVCGASLFDLMVGEPVWPDASRGYEAASAAFDRKPFAQGSVGAGTGATVGKLLGPESAMPGGIGHSFLRIGELVVGAVVAVNAAGNVCDRQGNWIAGAKGTDGSITDGFTTLLAKTTVLNPSASFGSEAPTTPAAPSQNTTLGVVVTNACLSKAQVNKLASSTHDAYARAICPVHTTLDGDIVFALASGKVEAPLDLVAALACEAMQDAIITSVTISGTR